MPGAGPMQCLPMSVMTGTLTATLRAPQSVPPDSTRAHSCCPTAQVLLAFSEGMLSPCAESEIRTHLLVCCECADLSRRLEEFERTSSSPVESDRYLVLQEIGRGGMGIVYRARDHTDNKIVALKLLRPEIASDADSLRRFENEMLLARDIRHPNLCQAYDLHRTSTSAFVTMEYLEGVTLRDRLERGPRLDVSEALRIAAQICGGLSGLHKRQIVHRDLKPENIVIQPNGNVKLVDFGLARRIDPDATSTVAAGTPAYMAPEQMAGRYVDDRTDIHALGVFLVELFGGAPCPAHRDSSDWLRDVPEELHEIVFRCLQVEMARRPHITDIAAVLLHAPHGRMIGLNMNC